MRSDLLGCPESEARARTISATCSTAAIFRTYAAATAGHQVVHSAMTWWWVNKGLSMCIKNSHLNRWSKGNMNKCKSTLPRPFPKARGTVRPSLEEYFQQILLFESSLPVVGSSGWKGPFWSQFFSSESFQAKPPGGGCCWGTFLERPW